MQPYAQVVTQMHRAPHPWRVIGGQRDLESVPNPERSEHCPPGVVLVRKRNAEESHQPVTQHGAHGALVSGDFLRGLLDELVHEVQQSVRPEALGQAGYIGQLARQDRCLLVLVLRGR
jgi:hypothetical protein